MIFSVLIIIVGLAYFSGISKCCESGPLVNLKSIAV